MVVTFCSRGGNDQQAIDVQEVAEVQQDGGVLEENLVTAEMPEDLRWRDAEFAVDPLRTTWSTKDNGRKVIYLTIDDGPSSITEKYLDLFDQYGVKATFFVTAQDPDYLYLIREAYKRGHTIGLHSYSHQYEEIYSSEQAFMKDLDAIGKAVAEQIGYVPCFIRFPGGASNTISADSSAGIMTKLTKDVVDLGYQYYDWNLDTGDGAGYDKDAIIQMTTSSGDSEDGYDPTSETNIMLLCHDTAAKEDTLAALPTIIEYYQGKGYSFEAIDRDTMVVHQEVNN